VIVTSEIPGVDPAEIEISVEGESLFDLVFRGFDLSSSRDMDEWRGEFSSQTGKGIYCMPCCIVFIPEFT